MDLFIMMALVCLALYIIVIIYAFTQDGKHPFWTGFLDIVTYRILWKRRR